MRNKFLIIATIFISIQFSVIAQTPVTNFIKRSFILISPNDSLQVVDFYEMIGAYDRINPSLPLAQWDGILGLMNDNKAFAIDLSNQFLSGNILKPVSFENCVSINLAYNSLTGKLNNVILEGSENLTYLDLSNNQLEGDISFLQKPNNTLMWLNLSNNRFTSFPYNSFTNENLQLSLENNFILPENLPSSTIYPFNSRYFRLSQNVPNQLITTGNEKELDFNNFFQGFDDFVDDDIKFRLFRVEFDSSEGFEIYFEVEEVEKGKFIVGEGLYFCELELKVWINNQETTVFYKSDNFPVVKNMTTGIVGFKDLEFDVCPDLPAKVYLQGIENWEIINADVIVNENSELRNLPLASNAHGVYIEVPNNILVNLAINTIRLLRVYDFWENEFEIVNSRSIASFFSPIAKFGNLFRELPQNSSFSFSLSSISLEDSSDVFVLRNNAFFEPLIKLGNVLSFSDNISDQPIIYEAKMSLPKQCEVAFTTDTMTIRPILYNFCTYPQGHRVILPENFTLCQDGSLEIKIEKPLNFPEGGYSLTTFETKEPYFNEPTFFNLIDGAFIRIDYSPQYFDLNKSYKFRFSTNRINCPNDTV
ncbi:MAG: hypothetical protein SNJ77_02065 [Cytophagales bacterium]